MSGYGFGLCGHRNEYSRGVLCGNWAENRRSSPVFDPTVKRNTDDDVTTTDPATVDVAQQQRPQVVPSSEKVLNNNVAKENVHFLSGGDIARKNKRSLAYASLCGEPASSHSNVDKDRFRTIHQLSYTNNAEVNTKDKVSEATATASKLDDDRCEKEDEEGGETTPRKFEANEDTTEEEQSETRDDDDDDAGVAATPTYMHDFRRRKVQIQMVSGSISSVCY